MMERLGSWLSPHVLHALGWALIHSLWQCLGVAALAAVLMAFSRRPSVRYLVGVAALALMLAAPVATFFVLIKPVVPVQLMVPAGPASPRAISPASSAAPADSASVAVVSGDLGNRAVAAITRSSRHIPLPDILPWLVAAWLCGVTLLSLRLAGGFLLLEHRRRSQTGALRPNILAICQELQRQLGLHHAIQYLECGWVQAPAVIGWLRPVVLLPLTAMTGLSEAELRAVIAHELAHIRRLDAFVNLFQIAVETLLFYHPGVWWLNRRIRAERELCCDDIAVSLTGNRLEYARALTRMAEWKDVPFLAMAANRGSLSERIFHILGQKPSSVGQRMLGLTGSILFLVAALGAGNALFGIAYPVTAQAKASIKAVLVSSQNAINEITRQALQPDQPATTLAIPDPTSRTDEAAPVAQTEAAQNAQPEKLVVPQPDLSQLVPPQSLKTPRLIASNEGPAIVPTVKQAPGAELSQNTMNNLLDAQIAHALKVLPIAWHCHNTTVWGRVVSSSEIQMPGFICHHNEEVRDPGTLPLFYGSCPHASAEPGPYLGLPEPSPMARASKPCPFNVTMYIQFANPADAGKMHAGQSVEPAGDFQVSTKDHVDYLFVKNAKMLQGNPFGQSTPDQHASNDAPATAGTQSQSVPQQSEAQAKPGGSTQGPILVRMGAQDSTLVQVRVNSEGKVTACSVVKGSGSDQTDGAACDWIKNNWATLNGQPTSINPTPPPIQCVAQQDALSEEVVKSGLATNLCVQTDILANLNRTGSALAKAVHSYAPFPAANGSTTDSNGITCRKRMNASLSRTNGTGGTLTCAYNSYWSEQEADARRRAFLSQGSNSIAPVIEGNDRP